MAAVRAELEVVVMKELDGGEGLAGSEAPGVGS